MMVVAVLAAALALSTPTVASAHPLLVGPWGAPTPGGPSVFDFGPGEYMGGGMWKGPVNVIVSGCPVSRGEYVLRIYDGLEATISIRDGLWITTRVGVVDLGAGVFEFIGIVYRR
jgi:hypothetical protein